MFEAKTRIRKWGNSYGVILPMKHVRAAKLRENDEVELIVKPKPGLRVKDIFGKLPDLKITTEEVIRLRKEMDSKYFRD